MPERGDMPGLAAVSRTIPAAVLLGESMTAAPHSAPVEPAVMPAHAWPKFCRAPLNHGTDGWKRCGMSSTAMLGMAVVGAGGFGWAAGRGGCRTVLLMLLMLWGSAGFSHLAGPVKLWCVRGWLAVARLENLLLR